MTEIKKSAPFVHLHNHTEYSLLDGAARVKQLVKRAKELDMPAVAITDHGVMYGVLNLYNAAIKEGIKPVIGCEVYVAPRSRFDKEAGMDNAAYHLVLLCENQEGYQNLCKLVSYAFLEGFYYKPRVDLELLKKYHKGLIALSACLAGEVLQNFLEHNEEEAYRVAKEYKEIFGEGNYFIELQNHGIEEQLWTNPLLVKLARDLDIPLVATNDIHYINKEDAAFHDILLCVQTGKTKDDVARMSFPSDQFYLKSREEMEALFGEYPEALENTGKIAERCNVNLDGKKVSLPKTKVPAGHDDASYLRELCQKGLAERYPEITPELQERLDYELKVICDMQFPGYFLVVWDLVNYCRTNGIFVGPGRGSAAGSLVAYTLGITNIDPIHYGLIFERFLNPERVSMPDIDTDFCYVRRGEVIDYLVNNYGASKVGQIITFGTMKAKMVVRDVARALNIPYAEADKIAKLIPADLKMTIEKALDASTELREMYESEEIIKELIDYSKALEGMPRHAGTHAAGVVIAPDDIVNFMPVQKLGDGIVTTQFEKEQVEEQGLLKMDILGLRTLTVIGDAVANIKKSCGVEIDIDAIPMDDKQTYEMLSNADTGGVFQLESEGMRAYLRRLQPERIEDIIAMVALYRPGPLESGMVGDYIDRKHGRQKVEYLHPMLESVLEETYGVMLYQEQVMQTASKLGGFSLGQADELRRAMGKKKADVLAKKRGQFLEGCAENKINAKTAGDIFDLMEKFAGYGFNKSHSAAYGVVSYQTAWLRAHYPAEYMAAMLTSFIDNADKVAEYLDECSRMKLEILPPDLNESYRDFTVVEGKIRFGLAAIKNVGKEAVDEIIAEREANGPYQSIGDACRRLKLNKKLMENFIKAGAMDCLGAKRAQLMAVYESALEMGKQYALERESLQMSLFDFGMTEAREVEIDLPLIEEYSLMEMLSMEKETIGFYVSGHPLNAYKELLDKIATHRTRDLAALQNMKTVKIAGIINQCQIKITKKGDNMAIFNLEDWYGSIRCVAFPYAYDNYRANIHNNAIVFLEAKAKVEDENVNLLVDVVHDLNQLELIDVPAGTKSPVKKEEPVRRSYHANGANGGNGNGNGNGNKNYHGKTKKTETEECPAKLFVRVENKQALPQVKEAVAAYSGNIQVFLYFNDDRRYQTQPLATTSTEAIPLLKERWGDSNVVLKLPK